MSERIREVFLEEDMKQSYLRYAMSVIISRALPDVRDGLKPSQRRILYAMYELNLGPTAKHRKCGKIVGDTIGNYHPHGDQAVYPTLVRMAQEFSTRYPLIDGQGNFGSIDGDPPAAMRYTEARLSRFGAEMLAEIGYETVDFVPNYDETRVEPVVLPSRFPNIICNGSSGIAVGMATSIPPHNLGEVIDGLLALAENPEIKVDQLLTYIKGPDFPTGGFVCGRSALRTAYRTGRGTVTVRGKVEIEEPRPGRFNIVITEIPYQVSRTSIKQSVVDSVESGRIEGVSDVRDESDRTGQRLVIEVRRGYDHEVILNQLYKHTPLHTSFSIILLALVENTPRTLNLKELLQAFLDHRLEVVRRRTTYLLREAEARLEVVEGLRKALRNIDEVVAVLKSSPNGETARARLVENFGFTVNQAQAILQMRLQRLTSLEQEKLAQEHSELLTKISEYKDILSSHEKTLEVVKNELRELKEKYAEPRRTQIADEAQELTAEDLIPDEPMIITVTHSGYVKRTPVDSYRSQKRGGRGVMGASTRDEDFVEDIFPASTHDSLLIFTDRGRCYRIKLYELPLLPRTARGRAFVNLIRVQSDERITAFVTVREFDQRFLFMATARGTVKKTPLMEFTYIRSSGIIAQRLREDDELIDVKLTDSTKEMMLISDDGRCVRFPERDVRPMGRHSMGVKGMRLRPNSRVIGLLIPEPGSSILCVSENGFAKRTPVSEYRTQSRGGKGILSFKVTDRTGKVAGAMIVRPADGIMVITQVGKLIRTSTGEIRCTGRVAQGVRLIRLDEGDRVASVARIAEEDG